jgi:hypothetical protein
VAAKIGFCGLDARRLPLNGDEIRPCWEAGSSASAPSIGAVAPPDAAVAHAGAASALAFIEVVATPPIGRSVPAEAAMPNSATPDAPATPFDGPAPRWSLWED